MCTKRDFIVKNLAIIKFIYLLFILSTFLISFCNATSNSEGLIQKDAKKHHLKPNSILDEETLNKIFPASKAKDFSHGWYCGQLRSKSGARGTGTLIKIEEKNGQYIGTGITALHVFLESFSGHKGIRKYHYTPNWTFYQNSTSPDNINLSFFAKIEVIKVLFNSELRKDICLFQGIYTLNGTYPSQDLANIISAVQDNLPKISKTLITSDKAIRVSLYHYPLGKLVQSKNEGELSSASSTHKISSLPGSSGASLLYKSSKKVIVGIHIGSVDGSNTGLIFKDTANNDIAVVENNSFNAVCENDIISMEKSTEDLHDLGPNSLYLKLVPTIYPETLFQSTDAHGE